MLLIAGGGVLLVEHADQLGAIAAADLARGGVLLVAAGGVLLVELADQLGAIAAATANLAGGGVLLVELTDQLGAIAAADLATVVLLAGRARQPSTMRRTSNSARSPPSRPTSPAPGGGVLLIELADLVLDVRLRGPRPLALTWAFSCRRKR